MIKSDLLNFILARWKWVYFIPTFGLVLLTSNYLPAQQINTDSLIQILEKENMEDSTRINLVLKVADKLFFSDQRKTIELLHSIDPIISKATKGQQVDQLHYFGGAYQYLGQPDSVEYYHSTILSIIRKEEDDRRYARALANLGGAYRAKGALDEAAQMYEEALEIFETKSDTFPKGTIRNSLGLIYDAKGDYKSAMKVYLEALDIFEMVNHEGAQAIVVNNIGRVYNAQKEYAKAIAYYKVYLETSKKSNNKNGIATALNNIGSVYIEMNELDSAIYCLEESIAIKKELGQERALSESFNKLGKIANIKGDYENAIDYNLRALELATKYEDKKGKGFILYELANSYMFLNQAAIAKSYYHQALDLAEEMGDLKLMYNASEGLYGVYKPQDLEIALRYLEKSFELKDTLLNAENVEALTTLRLENEFNKTELLHQQQIANLELQESLQTTRLSNQRKMIFGLLVISLLLAGLLYKLFSQKRKIEYQNIIINKSLKEKDTLLREIHHRVKNNLQVISSLLGLQSRNLRDQVAINALNESRSRVQSMSLIHQDLYQHDNLKGIRISLYFEKLIQSLFATYNISKEQIIVKADIDDLLLDVDTVIPLGLVINELLSNALKYAFPTGEGKIEISLKEKEDGLHLMVSDNGIGMENTESLTNSSSYGYKLVEALVDKLDGDLEIDLQNGTRVEAILKNYKIAA